MPSLIPMGSKKWVDSFQWKCQIKENDFFPWRSRNFEYNEFIGPNDKLLSAWDDKIILFLYMLNSLNSLSLILINTKDISDLRIHELDLKIDSPNLAHLPISLPLVIHNDIEPKTISYILAGYLVIIQPRTLKSWSIVYLIIQISI